MNGIGGGREHAHQSGSKRAEGTADLRVLHAGLLCQGRDDLIGIISKDMSDDLSAVRFVNIVDLLSDGTGVGMLSECCEQRLRAAFFGRIFRQCLQQDRNREREQLCQERGVYARLRGECVDGTIRTERAHKKIQQIHSIPSFRSFGAQDGASDDSAVSGRQPGSVTMYMTHAEHALWKPLI